MDQRITRRTRRPHGFTMIEIMLVVCIIGILSTLAIPRILRQAGRARRTEATGMVEKMRRHFIQIYRNQGSYPDVPAGSAWNPADTPSLMGSPVAWDVNAVGWKDFSFPPEGALRLRYSYTCTGNSLL